MGLFCPEILSAGPTTLLNESLSQTRLSTARTSSKKEERSAAAWTAAEEDCPATRDHSRENSLSRSRMHSAEVLCVGDEAGDADARRTAHGRERGESEDATP